MRAHIRDVLSHASCHRREDIFDLHDVAEAQGGVSCQIAFEEDFDLALDGSIRIEPIDNDLTHRYVLTARAIEDPADADKSADDTTISERSHNF